MISEPRLGEPVEIEGRWYVRYGVPGVDAGTAEIQARIRAVLDQLHWRSVHSIHVGPADGFWYVILEIDQPAAASMSLGLDL
jgi:hypothetical protein